MLKISHIEFDNLEDKAILVAMVIIAILIPLAGVLAMVGP